jgi:hypothetical protein
MRSHAGVAVGASACGCQDEESCNCSAGGAIARSAAGTAASAPPGFLRSIRGSGGHPLDHHARAFLEPRFGRDFSHIRVHSDSTAASNARAINAHAFTAGSDIFFGAGKYSLGTADGMRLLAHELTHTTQDRAPSMLLRQEDTSATDSDGIGDGPYDPCEVDVPSLTNEGLVNELGRARNYLHGRERGQDDYYAYANLMRRLVDERHTRMRAGQVWLGEDLDAMPTSLYRLSTGSFGEIEVLPQDVAAVRGTTASTQADVSIVTPAQFHAFLTSQNIPTVDPAEFFATTPNASTGPMRILPPLRPMASRPFTVPSPDDPFGLSSAPMFATSGITGGSTAIDPFDMFSRAQISEQVFSPNVNMNNPRSMTGARNRWRGALPEIEFASRGYGLGYSNLNDVQGNFPIYDFQSRFSSALISVKSVVPTQPGAAPNFSTYFDGFDDMVGLRRPATMTRAVTALNQVSGTQFTSGDLISRSQLAVNTDHVEAVRNAIEARVRTNPADYVNLFNTMLRAEPLTINGVQYRSYTDLQDARASGTIQQSDLDSTLDSLSRRARGRVIANGFTTEELRNMQNFRESFQNLSQMDFDRLAAPELIEAERYGGGWAGTRAAMGQALLRGGGQGMVLSAGFDLFRAAFDPEARDRLSRQLLVDVPLGGLGGATSSAIEGSLNTSISRSLLTEAGTSGAASVPGALPLLGRGFSGAVAGGITAPVITMLAMGLDSEHHYTPIDYTAKGTRAFVAGSAAGGGGALATGLVGAAAGSEVPVLGNAVGFVVGIGVYFLTDWLVGDAVEEEVRLEMGEGGCPRPVPDLDAEGGYE